ncbi:GNAT family N-acetyltransferase [Marinomonas sp. M1K-6]|uniref:GNAT family N-acetyltransferase n=1 Tax=Marinomonas profundi TaxID=2726122 RepID=A0A847R249_9GAMM|nr:GNAT family N-acetyltransferase [Marinomonas profundi]NLQ17842.1 GNAT family N-acetyltransferase [Marinomonas profundi]UDV03499.1 GNAT family N-acetyltransferase [Marinomonas profundi]
MIWHCQAFSELSNDTLYGLLKLRSDVFVVEQNCVFPDLDNLDTLPNTQHLFALQDNKVVAYARLLAKDDCYPDHSSIGRVVVAQEKRKDKLGHTLMKQAIAQTLNLWPESPIKIGAQSHLEGFYQAHGFVTVSAPYMEDGIEHYLMTRQAEVKP